MKLKCAITMGVPDGVVGALSDEIFVGGFFCRVLEKHLGVKNAQDRPAEYYVQVPDWAICANGRLGVECRLSGVSRDGRTPHQFHEALKALQHLICDVVHFALKAMESPARVQVFGVIMLDKEVEVRPGSGVYSNVLEHSAQWVTGAAIESVEMSASFDDDELPTV